MFVVGIICPLQSVGMRASMAAQMSRYRLIELLAYYMQCVLFAAIYNSLQKYLMEIAAATGVQLRYRGLVL